MMRQRSLTFGLTFAAAAAFAGCGDAPPSAPAPDGPAFAHTPGHGTGRNKLRVLKQDKDRTKTVSVTKTIGKTGGHLTADGVTLTIPAGALDSDVEITVTVPKGSYVEAHFEPHGLEFAEAATLRMDVKGALPEQAGEAAVDVTGKVQKDIQSGLQGVYFEGTLGEDAVAKEILGAVVEGDRATMKIRHFSGYCMASG